MALAKGFTEKPKTREEGWWGRPGDKGILTDSTFREEHKSYTGNFLRASLSPPPQPILLPKENTHALSLSRCSSETFEVPFWGHTPNRLCLSLCGHQGPSPRPALTPCGIWGWGSAL